jgi:hypothetical protein
MRRLLPVLAAVSILCAPLARAKEGSQWGRDLENRDRVDFGLSFGSILSVDGSVQETVRPIYEITGQPSHEGPENYSLDELGLNKSYPTYGLQFEAMWQYMTLQLNGCYFNPSTVSTADKDYYIGVNEVSYNGQNYDYMMIPKGREYDADVDAYRAGLRALITPFTLEAPGLPIEFVPSIYLGVAGVAFSYDIDAGPAEGTMIYQNPPHEFVVGGHGKGWNGVAVPEVGLGAEFILWQTLVNQREFTVSLKGAYSIVQYEGNTEDLGLNSSGNNKVIDLDYNSYEVWLDVDLPVWKTASFFVAAGYQTMNADAYVQAEDRPAEEALALREKFNKQIHIETSMFTGVLGLRF